MLDFKCTSVAGELGQNSLQADDISNLKLCMSKQASYTLGHSYKNELIANQNDLRTDEWPLFAPHAGYNQAKREFYRLLDSNIPRKN